MMWISRCSLILLLLGCSTTPLPHGCVGSQVALPREITVGPQRIALDSQFDPGAFRVSRSRNRYVLITRPVSSEFDSVLVDVGPDGRVGGLRLVLRSQRLMNAYLERYTRRYGPPGTGAADYERGGGSAHYIWLDGRTRIILTDDRPGWPEVASATLFIGNNRWPCSTAPAT